MKRYSVLFCLALLVALTSGPSVTFAHGGGLDGQGCHHNRKAGGYHCHRGPLAGKSFESKSDAARALSRPVTPRTIVGKANIIDGDTIEISGRQIDLFGISAPKPGQFCEAAGKKWACGQNATFGLSAIIERQWVHCHPKTPDTNGRIAAVCRLAGANGPDVNAAMVRQGWAQADRRGTAPYLTEEKAARAAKAGIWVGQDSAR
ncbi:MAG: endonuclease YncB(thermonuclease family) [Paracoccaceae bacterium]|jgi:endonuclease YncB( thermonuclease family)